MEFTILRSASFFLLAAFAIHHAQAHGSQGYAPDAYYRITDATTEETDLSTNSKIRLPVGCIIHVLWFKGEQQINKFLQIQLPKEREKLQKFRP